MLRRWQPGRRKGNLHETTDEFADCGYSAAWAFFVGLFFGSRKQQARIRGNHDFRQCDPGNQRNKCGSIFIDCGNSRDGKSNIGGGNHCISEFNSFSG